MNGGRAFAAFPFRAFDAVQAGDLRRAQRVAVEGGEEQAGVGRGGLRTGCSRRPEGRDSIVDAAHLDQGVAAQGRCRPVIGVDGKGALAKLDAFADLPDAAQRPRQIDQRFRIPGRQLHHAAQQGDGLFAQFQAPLHRRQFREELDIAADAPGGFCELAKGGVRPSGPHQCPSDAHAGPMALRLQRVGGPVMFQRPFERTARSGGFGETVVHRGGPRRSVECLFQMRFGAGVAGFLQAAREVVV